MVDKAISTFGGGFIGGICGRPTAQIQSVKVSRSYPVNEALLETATPRYLKVAYPFDRNLYMKPQKEHAITTFSYAHDLLYNRIWVFPQTIAAGFITEEQIHEITIWNAYLERSVDWTAIGVINENGTTFDYPTFPFTLPPTGDTVRDLTIEASGPPLQDTTWQITVDGLGFDVYTSGIRIVPLEPEPNWGRNIKMGYSFNTVMFNTERFFEQRRALQEISVRRASLNFVLKDYASARMFNRIAYGHDKIFGIPIYPEKLYPTAVTQGTNTVNVSNSTEFMWNLKNRAAFIVIVDHENHVIEIKEFTQVNDYDIVLKTAIIESFDITRTVVYPCLFATVQSVKYGEPSSHVRTAAIEFKEYLSSG